MTVPGTRFAGGPATRKALQDRCSQLQRPDNPAYCHEKCSVLSSCTPLPLSLVAPFSDVIKTLLAQQGLNQVSATRAKRLSRGAVSAFPAPRTFPAHCECARSCDVDPFLSPGARAGVSMLSTAPHKQPQHPGLGTGAKNSQRSRSLRLLRLLHEFPSLKKVNYKRSHKHLCRALCL